MWNPEKHHAEGIVSQPKPWKSPALHSQHCLQPCCYFLCIDRTQVLLFFGGVGVFYSFLLNLLPASLPSSSENSEWNSDSIPFPQDFPSPFCCPFLLYSSPTLEFLPEMRTVCIARICRPLFLHELLPNSLIWWGETKHCNPTIFCSEKNFTWSFSFKAYVIFIFHHLNCISYERKTHLFYKAYCLIIAWITSGAFQTADFKY